MFLNFCIRIGNTFTVVTLPSIHTSLHPKPHHLRVDLDPVNKNEISLFFRKLRIQLNFTLNNLLVKKASFLAVLNKY